jgi:hypothetical protein
MHPRAQISDLTLYLTDQFLKEAEKVYGFPSQSSGEIYDGVPTI